MESYLINSNIESCSGCGACIQACPMHCISFVASEDGFNVPIIDQTKCIHCNKCVGVCQYSSPVDRFQIIKSFYVKAKDIEAQRKSSSGGCFYGLARLVIDRGGFVFGAVMDKHFQCVHQEATCLDEMTPLLGSKYVQSRCDPVFPIIKKKLNTDRPILFVGTPCQIVGLKNYLNKEYENLLLVDVACHGVPSQNDFSKCLKWLEDKHKGKVTYLKFRDKYYAGWRHSLTYKIEKKGTTKVYTVAPYKIPYYYFFLYSRNIRKSCYQCPYVGTFRVGDITLADFWAAERLLKENEIGTGVSVALCSTDKGIKWLNSSGKYLNVRKIDNEIATKDNQPFSKLPNLYQQRDELLKIVLHDGYDNISRYYGFKERILASIKAVIPETTKRSFLRLLGEKK